MKTAGCARSAPRLLGKASSRQSGVEAAPPGCRTFRQNGSKMALTWEPMKYA